MTIRIAAVANGIWFIRGPARPTVLRPTFFEKLNTSLKNIFNTGTFIFTHVYSPHDFFFLMLAAQISYVLHAGVFVC